MKFNRYVSKDVKKLLEEQYNEYVKSTKMTKKEKYELREWVKNGNSVYDNPFSDLFEYFPQMDFLSMYRQEEYIRKHTKGMSAEEAKKFALDYLDSDNSKSIEWYVDALIYNYLTDNQESDDDLPF